MTTVHKVESQCICCFVVFFLAWIFIKVWLQIFITFCLLVYLLYIYFVNNIQIFTIYSTLIWRWSSMFTTVKTNQQSVKYEKTRSCWDFQWLKNLSFFRNRYLGTTFSMHIKYNWCQKGQQQSDYQNKILKANIVLKYLCTYYIKWRCYNLGKIDFIKTNGYLSMY